MNKPVPKSVKPVPVSKLEKAKMFAQATPEGELARVNANVPIHLHRRLKIHSVVTGLSMNDLVVQWLESLPAYPNEKG